MNLDDAIKHCEEIAMDKTNLAQTLWDSKEKARCEEYAEEHRQLAEWLRDYKRLLEQEPIITSTEDNAEMIYPQVEGITPMVVEPIPDVDKEVEKYRKMLKHPVIKHIMDEEQEQLDFVRPHKKNPVTLTVRGYDRLIDLANAIENDDSGYWTNKKISSALRNISSIKPQPCEDVISREAVLKLQYRIDDSATLSTRDVVNVEDIEDLPSVTLQEKTGHWILQPSNKDQGERDFVWWKCSECGQVIYSGAENDRREFHAFCGRCGARMEVEQNG